MGGGKSKLKDKDASKLESVSQLCDCVLRGLLCTMWIAPWCAHELYEKEERLGRRVRAVRSVFALFGSVVHVCVLRLSGDWQKSSRVIDSQLAKDRQKDAEVIKLLLLGKMASSAVAH